MLQARELQPQETARPALCHAVSTAECKSISMQACLMSLSDVPRLSLLLLPHPRSGFQQQELLLAGAASPGRTVLPACPPAP